jgi:hypothetical protein
MKNKIFLLTILVLASSSVFAFDAFKPNQDQAKDVTQKLESAKQASEKQSAAQVKYITGTILEGSFSKDQLAGKNGVTLKQGIINITFYVEPKKGSIYGDIVYKAVKTDKFDTLEFNMETARLSKSDPHSPVDVSVIVTAVKNGKEVQTGKAIVLTVEALSLYSIEPSSSASDYQGPSAGPDGKCTRCGSNDPYHCNGSYTGPCEKKDSAKTSVPTKVVYEEDVVHVAGCKDPYHCGCPTEQVRKVVPMEKVEVKVHKADCKDPYHCDCPTKTEYR